MNKRTFPGLHKIDRPDPKDLDCCTPSALILRHRLDVGMDELNTQGMVAHHLFMLLFMLCCNSVEYIFQQLLNNCLVLYGLTHLP